MPKILDEADTFPSAVAVPVGDDDMDTHAEDLETFVQTLTNRTRYLRNRTAKLDTANTWPQSNTFDGAVTINTQLTIDPDAANQAAIHVDRTGGDHQFVLSARAGSGGDDRARIYSGAHADTIGSLFFVINAEWTGTAWHQVDATKKSTAIIMRNHDVRVVGRAAGAADWTSWPQNTISDFGAEMLAEIFRSERMYTVGPTDAANGNGFRYTDPVLRTSPIDLGRAFGNVAFNVDGHLKRNASVVGHDTVWIPLGIPPGCSFRTVRIRMAQLQAGTQPDEWRLMRKTGTGSWAAVTATETHGTYNSDTTANFHGGGASQLVTDNQIYAYRWRVVSGDPASIENRILGAEIDWTDVGPSNVGG